MNSQTGGAPLPRDWSRAPPAPTGAQVFPVVSTEARRAERRDLASTVGRLSLKQGLSAPRGVYPEVFEGRSGRDDGNTPKYTTCEQNRLDVPEQCCGLCVPALTMRIGSMAFSTHPRPATRVSATRVSAETSETSETPQVETSQTSQTSETPS